MTTAPITAADICNAGTQVKILLKLQGDQKVLFKPIRSVNVTNVARKPLRETNVAKA